jgi:hypothetical protein
LARSGESAAAAGTAAITAVATRARARFVEKLMKNSWGFAAVLGFAH